MINTLEAWRLLMTDQTGVLPHKEVKYIPDGITGYARIGGKKKGKWFKVTVENKATECGTGACQFWDTKRQKCLFGNTSTNMNLLPDNCPIRAEYDNWLDGLAGKKR